MQPFVYRLRVRHYELDALGHVNNAVYVNFLQQAEAEAGLLAGSGPERSGTQGATQTVRRLTIRYHAQATFGDDLEVTTWVSSVEGGTCTREFEITRVGDAARVARARVLSAYTDPGTGELIPVPEIHAKAVHPAGGTEDLGVRRASPRPTGGPHRYCGQRRVQFHELDATGRVGPAALLQWVGQAYFDALRAAGYPPERARREGWLILQGGHDLEVFSPAGDDDPIAVVSWVCELGRVRGAWTHEVYHAGSGRLLARDYSLGVFVNRQGKPAPLPPSAIDDVLRGPRGTGPAPDPVMPGQV